MRWATEARSVTQKDRGDTAVSAAPEKLAAIAADPSICCKKKIHNTVEDVYSLCTDTGSRETTRSAWYRSDATSDPVDHRNGSKRCLMTTSEMMRLDWYECVPFVRAEPMLYTARQSLVPRPKDAVLLRFLLPPLLPTSLKERQYSRLLAIGVVFCPFLCLNCVATYPEYL